MDPELREYLEATEQRLATKADLDAMRQENAERFASVEQRMVGMEQRMATKADLDALRVEIQASGEALRAEIQAGDQETRRYVDVLRQELRQGQVDIIKRLDEGFAA